MPTKTFPLSLYYSSRSLLRSFSCFEYLCFGSGRDQLFSILVAFTLQHKAHSHRIGLVYISLCALLFIYMYAIVCGKYFSYKLPDAIHSDFSLIHNDIFTAHLYTNYVQNKLCNGFIRLVLFSFSHVIHILCMFVCNCVYILIEWKAKKTGVGNKMILQQF